MKEEDFISPDEYEFSSSKETTYQQIVLQQFNRCIQLHSTDLTGGFTTQKITKTGEVVESYIEDREEAFCNAVNILHDLLLIKGDEEYKKSNNDINKKLKELHKEYQDKLDNKSDIDLYKKKRKAIIRRRFQELSNLWGRLDYLGSTSMGKDK